MVRIQAQPASDRLDSVSVRVLSASMADAISSAPGYGNNGRREHPAVDYSGLPPSDTPSQRSEPRHNLPLSGPLWNVAA
jgi:hypothetical protein